MIIDTSYAILYEARKIITPAGCKSSLIPCKDGKHWANMILIEKIYKYVINNRHRDTIPFLTIQIRDDNFLMDSSKFDSYRDHRLCFKGLPKIYYMGDALVFDKLYREIKWRTEIDYSKMTHAARINNLAY